MEYRSPLGLNFNLKKGLEKLEREESETPKKNPEASFIPFQSETQEQPRRSFQNDSNPRWSGGNMRRSNYSGNSPGFGGRQSNNWGSPNQRNFQQKSPAPISQYYNHSMMEDPWRALENQKRN